MNPVFCSKCKYCYVPNLTIGVYAPLNASCTHPSNIKKENREKEKNWFQQIHHPVSYFKLPSELNANNDCDFFEKKLNH